MHTMRRSLCGVAVVLTALAGCGGGDDDSMSDPAADEQVDEQQASGDSDQADQSDDANSDEEFSATVQGDDGDVSMNISGDLPDGFPLPVPDGVAVESSLSFGSDDGDSYQVALTAPKDDFDSITEFYEAALDDGGFEVTRQNIESDGAKVVYLYGSSDAADVIISLSIDGATDKTSISLIWGPAT